MTPLVIGGAVGATSWIGSRCAEVWSATAATTALLVRPPRTYEAYVAEVAARQIGSARMSP
ncbi:MAG TPA: hypothetical protein VM513_28005 [Kofleriaceae bacterium]|jgi:hypothetical protein|nr:hypothetical protein [Kofleriaceae bacterium]